MQNFSTSEAKRIALCDVLDRVLNKGAVVCGEVRISVANIDLVYLGLQLLLTSIETARKVMVPLDGMRCLGAGARVESGDWLEIAPCGNRADE